MTLAELHDVLRALLRERVPIRDLTRILEAISAIGYHAHPFDPGRQEQVYRDERRAALRRLAVAGLGMMQVMMIAVALYAGAYEGMDAGLRNFLRWVSLLLTLPVMLYSARSAGAAALSWIRLSRCMVTML